MRLALVVGALFGAFLFCIFVVAYTIYEDSKHNRKERERETRSG